jgi:hypothetical protein
MSDPAYPPSGESSTPQLNLLLIDESDADRDQLFHLLTHTMADVGAVHQASTLEGAWEIAKGLDRLDALVAGIPEAYGEALFDLRDRLAGRFGKFAAAFCSREDMSPYYDRVDEGEMLFFKPVDDQVMRDWLAENTAFALSGGESILETGSEAAEEPVAYEPEFPDSVEPAAESAPPPPGPGDALPDGLLAIGTQLGDYQLLNVIQHDENLAMYEAEQISIGRKVAIKTLFRRHRTDPDWVGAFAHEARARALVSHSNISLVYEADQDRGVTFYTLELIDGPTLAQLAAAGQPVDEPSLWRILKVCADALHYLKSHQMEHRMISADTIFLVGDGQPRIANPVKPGTPMPEEDSAQMRLIAEAVRPFLRSGGKADKRLAALLDRMSNPARIDGVRSGHGLVEAIRHLEDQALRPTPRAKQEQRSNKTAVVSGIFVGLAILVGGLIYQVLIGGRPEVKAFDTMVRVPAGACVYQNGEKMELPVFWIDEHEVTIAQYAEFLQALKDDPTLLEAVKHPNQPEKKRSHRPKDWEVIHTEAMRGGDIKGTPVDPNCPVMNVDWWDAYAYAKWKGNRLPTEQEWEKAARGAEGSIFPWGNEIDLTKFNSGADQDEKANGNQDGYRYWGPVDVLATDASPYGVKGMAGNVSEWTDSWDTHPQNPDLKVPIKRGASFYNKDGFELTARRPATMAEEATLWTGFRTARSEEPLPLGSIPPRPVPGVKTGAGPESVPAPAPDSGMTPGTPAPAPGTPAPAPGTPAPAPGTPAPAPGTPAPAPGTPAPAPGTPAPAPGTPAPAPGTPAPAPGTPAPAPGTPAPAPGTPAPAPGTPAPSPSN